MGMRLKKISAPFTEDEFERLKAVKVEIGLSWHDFLLEMLEVFIRSGELGAPGPVPEKNKQHAQKLVKLRF